MPPKPSFIATRPLTRSQVRSNASKRIQKATKQVSKTVTNKTRAQSGRPPAVHTLLTDLQTRLQASSSPAYRKWLTRYLRNEAPCRGLKTPEVQTLVSDWMKDNGLDEEHPHERELVRKIFESEWNEDKLAGTLYLNRIQKAGRFRCVTADIAFLEELFDTDLIQPWNTVDQLCSRVVAGLIHEGGLDIILSWVHAKNLWRARAGIVGLISYLGLESVREKALEGCAVLILREERFAKTAVGWALREMQRRDEDIVVKFVEEFAREMSLEATKNACKHMDNATKKRLIDLVKAR